MIDTLFRWLIVGFLLLIVLGCAGAPPAPPSCDGIARHPLGQPTTAKAP